MQSIKDIRTRRTRPPPRFAMRVGAAFAVLVLTGLEPVAANGFCGGFDLDNHGQAGQCLSDDNSRNGAVLIPPAEEVQA